MNIKITYNWLLDYLETDADPYEIQKYLSLCGPSIERVDKVGEDYVFDIEITSNRVDMASVFGIAQEAVAILPQFGKKAKLKFDPLTKYRFSNIQKKYSNKNNVKVSIKDKDLCSRFSALIFENINLTSSPEIIKKRLQLCDIRSINNVVDISNYLMLSLGQPVHTFDFDQIKKSTMIMRKSKKGEKIITLDEKEIILPGNDIIMEDGDERLIDLCGIMGGKNSAVSEKTKNVLLFVQTYNKNLIRKTTMLTGQRTEAATLFEKGLDTERVEPTLVYGTLLLEQFAQGKIASNLTDIYPNKYQEKKVVLNTLAIKQLIGVEISDDKIKKILSRLGFKIYDHQVGVPSWRQHDISINEDLVEEVARIYGYNSLPNNLQSVVYLKQPLEIEQLFTIQSKVKYLLKHLGLNEVINYSMISKKMIENIVLNTKNNLHLSNSISEDFKYLRNSLIPSLIKNIKDNFGRKEEIRMYEIGKVYLPQENELPKELYKLGIVSNTDYFDLKGIIEAVLRELNINNFSFEIKSIENAFVCEIDLKQLIDSYKSFPVYKPINPYALIKLDKTFTITPSLTYEVIQRLAQRSKLLQKMEFLSLYKNKLSIRFYYSALDYNLTEKEAKEELDLIN